MILLSLFVTTISAAASGPGPAQETVVPVTLRVETPLADGVTDFLGAEVEQIFSPLGVRLQQRPPGAPVAASVVVRDKPARPRIVGCSRDLHDHRLALTMLASRRIILWTRQVSRGARGDWGTSRPPRLPDRDLGRALGRVLAHELGHLLFGLTHDPPSGLMKASFRHRELTGKRSKNLSLSGNDVEALRARLARYLKAIEAQSDRATRRD